MYKNIQIVKVPLYYLVFFFFYPFVMIWQYHRIEILFEKYGKLSVGLILVALTNKNKEYFLDNFSLKCTKIFP